MAFAALLALASSSSARGEEPARTRVTIRGTGSNVTIEETQAPARRPVFGRNVVSPDALGEAIRLKKEGADDARVIASLRAREADLPPVIDAATMKRLRRAGAGKSVAAYLATVAAVDIGETGEGHEAAVSYAAAPVAEAGMPIYDAPYAYPLTGGYAPRFPTRRHNSGFSLRHAPFPHRQPVLHRSFPMHPVGGRRPFG